MKKLSVDTIKQITVKDKKFGLVFYVKYAAACPEMRLRWNMKTVNSYPS